MDPDAFHARTRLQLVLLGLACAALLAGALYLQLAKGEDPCPLCVLQRYAYVLIGVTAFATATTRRVRSMLIGETLILLFSAVGTGLAVRLAWVQSHPSFSCGFDALQPIVDSLPPAKLLPVVFKVGGLCETVYPPILGLTLPQWSLVTFVLIFVLVCTHLLRRPRRV
jgi:disulfide bond formation protein DsbB